MHDCKVIGDFESESVVFCFCQVSCMWPSAGKLVELQASVRGNLALCHFGMFFAFDSNSGVTPFSARSAPVKHFETGKSSASLNPVGSCEITTFIQDLLIPNCGGSMHTRQDPLSSYKQHM